MFYDLSKGDITVCVLALTQLQAAVEGNWSLPKGSCPPKIRTALPAVTHTCQSACTFYRNTQA